MVQAYSVVTELVGQRLLFGGEMEGGSNTSVAGVQRKGRACPTLGELVRLKPFKNRHVLLLDSLASRAVVVPR